MPQKRSSHNRKAALRFVALFDQLLDEMKTTKPQGMFLACDAYNNVAPATLQNRFSDALAWLRKFNVDEKIDRRLEYQMLRDNIMTRQEDTGVRVILLCGPNPSALLRPDGGNPEGQTQQAEWKSAIEAFFQSPFDEDNCIKEIPNCLITNEDLAWLERICGAIGASYTRDGDRIVVARAK